MKKTIISVLIVAILVSGTLLAFAKQKEDDINKHILKAEQQLNKFSNEDLETILRNQGKYQDEIDSIMSKYIGIIGNYDVDKDTMDRIIKLTKEGKELEQLLNIYEFITLTTGEYRHLMTYYEMGAQFDFRNKYWLEEAFNYIYNKQPLSVEEINEYYSQGLSEKDILTANYFSMCGEKDIKEIANDKKANKKSWKQISEETNKNVSYLTFAFNADNQDELVQYTKDCKQLKSEKNQKEKKKLRNDKTKEKLESRTNLTNSQLIILAKEKVPNLSNEDLEKYLNEGNYIREIEFANNHSNGNKEKLEEILKYGLEEEV